MRAFARLLIALPLTLASLDSRAKPSADDFDVIGQRLGQYALELRDIGNAMRTHATTPTPADLDQDRRKIFAAKRRQLEEAGEAALKLAGQVEGRARKARHMTLTRADMRSLSLESDALAQRVDARTLGVQTSKPGNSAALDRRLAAVEAVPENARNVEQLEPRKATGLNETIKEVEALQETARNKRQQAVTAFQNFDQKWNQLFNMLTTVLKNKKDMDAGVTRNML